MKRFLIGIALAPVLAAAQTPDVTLRIDVNPTYRMQEHGVSTFRWYDNLGRHSTVGLSMILEMGFRVLITQRLQRIEGDGDPDQLDEYYIEDEGNWRVGKQYLPFGRGLIFRESAKAARAETNLLFENLPIIAAACDSGPQRQRGIVGRVGRSLGASFAFGRNFGISSTSFALVRSPEEALGEGRGYQTIVGVDAARRFGEWLVQAEMVALRGGETSEDREHEISDLNFTYAPSLRESFTVGWSRNWSKAADIYRLQGQLLMTKGLWLEPMIRFQAGELKDVAITVRGKM